MPLNEVERQAAIKAEAERWLRDFADQVGMHYGEVIRAGRNYIDTGYYYVQRDSEAAHAAMREDETRLQFWKHFQAVTGVVASEKKRKSVVFSCSG